MTFSNQSTGNITTWLWDFGDGTQSTAGDPLPHVYTESGEKLVSLTATGPGGSDQYTQICTASP